MRSRSTLSFSTSQRPTRAGGFHSPTAVMTRVYRPVSSCTWCSSSDGWRRGEIRYRSLVCRGEYQRGFQHSSS